jgi:hypothetical protein
VVQAYFAFAAFNALLNCPALAGHSHHLVQRCVRFGKYDRAPDLTRLADAPAKQ